MILFALGEPAQQRGSNLVHAFLKRVQIYILEGIEQNILLKKQNQLNQIFAVLS